MDRFDWAKLTPLQVGKYAEYYTKMEFTLWGFDVFSAEVDEHGIDFVVRRHPGPCYDVQVKSSRGFNYIFFEKAKFDPQPNLLAAVVLFNLREPPLLFPIPSMAWKTTTSLIVDHDYPGKKSKPEWGLNLSKKNMAELGQFAFDRIIASLVADHRFITFGHSPMNRLLVVVHIERRGGTRIISARRATRRERTIYENG